eukprot:TRINITY_DN1105_c0_g2_i1.p3 TRINITY_DN1105_c0_g2~~TRINITY_DN1105_c0_g2_i1.p3  ORF type:complete len:171 (+),score=63.17 TRINITY_DN1105_c0_g2_i1:58-513(+)
MSVSFVKNAAAKDVVHGVDAEGNATVEVPCAGGDYMVVNIALPAGESEFYLHVSGFGFEIGMHDPAQGFTRKLTDPLVSMIPAPAQKAAAHSAVTGLFKLHHNNGSLNITIPSFEGAAERKTVRLSDPSRFAIVLGGHVSVTLKGALMTAS